MKKILYTIIVLTLSTAMVTPSVAQEQITVSVFREAPDNTNDYLHRAGNEFAKMVGDTLKSLNHRISHIVLDMKYYSERDMYRVTYYAMLEPVVKDEKPHKRFGRRGAMTILTFNPNNQWAEMERARSDTKERTVSQFSQFRTTLDQTWDRSTGALGAGAGEFLSLTEIFFTY